MLEAACFDENQAGDEEDEGEFKVGTVFSVVVSLNQFLIFFSNP
jgi:hypothetical protein